MATIRRHPTMFGGAALLVMLGLAIWLVWPTAPLAHADQPNYPALDPVAAAQLETLRSQAGLDDDALACLNPTNDQLLALLPAVRSWYETHTPSWRAAWSAVADQEARIRQLETAIANGENQAAALNAARQQLVQLQAAVETQVADLRATATSTLSESQQTLLALVRTNRDRPMPFRILGLTSEQQHALTLATADYRQKLALARDDQTRKALAAQYAQAVQAAIGPTNVQLLASLTGYRGDAAERVVAALATVFPVTQEG